MSSYQNDVATFYEIYERIVDRVNVLNRVGIFCEICDCRLSDPDAFISWQNNDNVIMCSQCRTAQARMKNEEV